MGGMSVFMYATIPKPFGSHNEVCTSLIKLIWLLQACQRPVRSLGSSLCVINKTSWDYLNARCRSFPCPWLRWKPFGFLVWPCFHKLSLQVIIRQHCKRNLSLMHVWESPCGCFLGHCTTLRDLSNVLERISRFQNAQGEPKTRV